MYIKLSKRENVYWSEVSNSSAQVFLGILAAIVLLGPLEIVKIPVVVLTLVITIIFWLIGWKLVQ